MNRLWTVGTSNRTKEAFVQLLRAYGLEQVVDVRRFPTSERFPWFRREEMARWLPEVGIRYVWMGRELGGYRPGGYEAFTQTSEFQAAVDRLLELAARCPTTLVCAEKLPWRCHRLWIARAVERRGWSVVHILDETHTWNPNSVAPPDNQTPWLFPKEEDGKDTATDP